MNINLLNYYADVLGISQILLPSSSKILVAEPVQKKPSQSRLVFLAKGESFSAKELQLFEKVIGSIGISLNDCDVLFVNKKTSSQILDEVQKWNELGALFICLDQELLLELHKLEKLKEVFFLNHPAMLIENPSLKRPAWETLKKIKQILDVD